MFWYHRISLGIRCYSMNVSPWDREFKLQQACCSERRGCEATDAMALHEFHDRELILLNHVTLSLLGGSLVSRGSRDFWSPIRPPCQRKSGASRLHIPQYMGGDKRPKSHSGKSGTSGVRKGTRTKSNRRVACHVSKGSSSCHDSCAVKTGNIDNAFSFTASNGTCLVIVLHTCVS